MYLDCGGRERHSIFSLVLFAKEEIKLPVPFLFQYFEIAVISRQLDCEFKNTQVSSKLQDSLLVLLSNDKIA